MVLLLPVLGNASEVAGETDSLGFTNITDASGTGGPNTFGGHGVQWADVNGDGRPDFYVTLNHSQNEDVPELFYRNESGSTFQEEAAARGIDDFDSGSHGGTWADLDNDGDYDLYNGSYERNRVYRNDGVGFFTDATLASGIPDRAWATRGVVAFDMDGDGDLDLFSVTGHLGSDDPPGERNEVYRNEGNMQFTSIDSGDLFTAPAGQGATDSDFDGDGDVDILAANQTGDLNILRNDGNGNFTLVPPASLGITDRADDGVSLADVDNDGHLDILVGKRLYLNDGDNTYTLKPNSPGGPGYMGGFEDLDNDGDWDLVFPGDDKVLLNDGAGNFSESAPFTTCAEEAWLCDPRCVAFADIDDDGDADFFYANKRVHNTLIRNDYSGPNHWLEVRLVRASGQAGAFGAKVYAYQAGQLGNDAARITWREARSQEGYLGQNDPLLHLGLGDAATVDLRVAFLNGLSVDLTGVAASRTIKVMELVTLFVEPGELRWTALTEATAYDIMRGDLRTLRDSGGDFGLASERCLADDHPDTTLALDEDPAPGEAYWYLVRGIVGGEPMSYDSLTSSQVGSRDDEINSAPQPRRCE